MSWPLWVWERITRIAPVDRWIGRNIISALGSFTVLVFILALVLILRDWGFSQTQRFILTVAAFILMGLSVAAGIGLALLPGEPLSFGRAFGTQENPRTRREARRVTPAPSTSQLLSLPANRGSQP